MSPFAPESFVSSWGEELRATECVCPAGTGASETGWVLPGLPDASVALPGEGDPT
ncbi:hypothetical protein BH11MYX4_BH11MYX4_65280 [soil metagenome]